MTEYRVKEYQGKFYIQGKFHDFEYKYNFLSLWGFCEPKEIDKGCNWHSVNDSGRKCMRYYRLGITDSQLGAFDSLESAMNQIKLFQSDVKFHYPK